MDNRTALASRGFLDWCSPAWALRASRLGQGRLDVVAQPVHQGRTQQVWDVHINWADDGSLWLGARYAFSMSTSCVAE